MKKILVCCLLLAFVGCSQEKPEPLKITHEVTSFILTTERGEKVTLYDLEFHNGSSFRSRTEKLSIKTALAWKEVYNDFNNFKRFEIIGIDYLFPEVRITYNDDDVLEGTIQDLPAQFQYFKGHDNHSNVKIKLLDVKSVEKQVTTEEVKL